MSDLAIDVKRPVVGGLVGFVVEMVRRGRAGLGVARAERSMKVVETLQLGGKRQLMLVSCGAQQYLVGAGVDGVQTIVPVHASAANEVWP
jgi:flagellar biogenesis protein FliO